MFSFPYLVESLTAVRVQAVERLFRVQAKARQAVQVQAVERLFVRDPGVQVR